MSVVKKEVRATGSAWAADSRGAEGGDTRRPEEAWARGKTYTREIEQRRWGGRRETVHARLAMAAMMVSELSWCKQQSGIGRCWKVRRGEVR